MVASKVSAAGILVITLLVTQASAQFPVTPREVSQTVQISNDSIPHDPQLLDKLYHGRLKEIGPDKFDLVVVFKAFEAAGLQIQPELTDLHPTTEQLLSIGRYFSDPGLAAKVALMLPRHPNYQATGAALEAHGGVNGEWAQTTYENLVRLVLERANQPTINEPSDDSGEWAKRYPSKGASLTIYSFKIDEATPRSGLVQGDDHNFYGTTSQGGIKAMGTVFRLTPDGKATTLHVFTGPDGGVPVAELVKGRDGNFYGTASGNGSSGGGTVFRITPKGEFTTLYNFNHSPDGHQPMAALVLGRDGNFYGTTSLGGEGDTGGRGTQGGSGTVFRITPNGKLTILHSFKEGPGEATYPAGPLVEGDDGNFYGLTSRGGATAHEPTSYRLFPGDGSIYKITPVGEFSIIHSFGPNRKDGLTPAGGLAKGDDGNFYGVTASGGEIAGIIFRITPSGEFTNLRSFQFSEGGGVKPLAGLLKGKDGNFYGSTTAGGTHPAAVPPPGNGTLFRLTPANQYTTLHSFQKEAVPDRLYGHFLTEAKSKAEWAEREAAAGRAHPELTEGKAPAAVLLQAADGNIYGTTSVGGALNFGTIFQFDPKTVSKP